MSVGVERSLAFIVSTISNSNLRTEYIAFSSRTDRIGPYRTGPEPDRFQSRHPEVLQRLPGLSTRATIAIFPYLL